MRTTFIVLACAGAISANAATQVFNAATAADNAAQQALWMTAAGITTPQFFEDFESYALNANMEGVAIAGGAVINNTGSSGVFIKSNSSDFGFSNPIDEQALQHNGSQWLEFTFVTPTAYLGFYTIDSPAGSARITLSDNSVETYSMDATATSGDSAEFFGFVPDSGLTITKLQLTAPGGDGQFGTDNMMYGAVPEPASMIALGAGLAALLRRRRNG